MFSNCQCSLGAFCTFSTICWYQYSISSMNIIKNRNPYGRLSWIFLIAIAVASMFFWISAFHCFLTVSKTENYNLYIGYWQRESPEISEAASGVKDGNYCVAWDKTAKENFFDGLWGFGRFLTVMGTIVSVCLFFLAFYLLFFKVGTRVFTGTFGASIFVGISSLLFLTSLGSNICEIFECRLGPGGYLAVFDFFLWMGVAYIAYKLKALSQDPNYSYGENNTPSTAIIVHPESSPPKRSKRSRKSEGGDTV